MKKKKKIYTFICNVIFLLMSPVLDYLLLKWHHFHMLTAANQILDKYVGFIGL